MVESIQPSREALAAMAASMAEASSGRLRLVRNEADDSDAPDMEAASFLKLDGRRLGRDLELYAFMATVQDGWGPVLPDLACEVVLPLRRILPEACGVGVGRLVEMGRAVYDADRQADWAAIFDDGPQPGEAIRPGPR